MYIVKWELPCKHDVSLYLNDDFPSCRSQQTLNWYHLRILIYHLHLT